MRSAKCLAIVMVVFLLSAFAATEANALNLISVFNFGITMTSATTGFYSFDVENKHSSLNLVSIKFIDDPRDNFFSLDDFSSLSLGAPTGWSVDGGSSEPKWNADTPGLAPGSISTGFKISFTLAGGVLSAPTLAHISSNFFEAPFTFDQDSQDFEAPEPGTLLLLGSGLLGAGLIGRFKKRKRGSKTNPNT